MTIKVGDWVMFGPTREIGEVTDQPYGNPPRVWVRVILSGDDRLSVDISTITEVRRKKEQ